METRQVTEYKVHQLVLNPMRSNTEDKQVVAISFDMQELIDWFESEKVEPYVDEGLPSFDCHGDSHAWHKTFRKGGPLEWFNCPDSLDPIDNYFGHGISYIWIDEDTIEDIRNGNIAPGIEFVGNIY